MNRYMFMTELEMRLRDVPAAEREEAIQYYNSYFDDAGRENEAQVLAELGSPDEVAQSIKRDAGILDFSNLKNDSDTALMKYEEQVEGENRETDNTYSNYGYEMQNAEPGKQGMSFWVKCLIALAIIVAVPVCFGGIASALGALIGLVAGWFGLIIGFGAATLGLGIASIILLVTGIPSLFVVPVVGLVLLACSLICGALAVLFLALVTAMAGVATPAIWRGLKGLFRWVTNLFQRNK